MLNGVLAARYPNVAALVVLVTVQAAAGHPFFVFKVAFIHAQVAGALALGSGLGGVWAWAAKPVSSARGTNKIFISDEMQRRGRMRAGAARQ